MTKKKNYTIVDHVGSIENEVLFKKAYETAKTLSPTENEYFTLKKFCRMIPDNPTKPKKLWEKKQFVRENKHPDQLIFICTDPSNWKQAATLDSWNVDISKIQIILVQDTIEILTMADLHPEWFALKEPTSTIYRRCANIWGQALGWEFSAPLYRDNNIASEIDVMKYKRNDRELLIANGNGDHITKTSHTPESYMKSKIVASEEECKEFFEYYKYLYKKHLLEEFLEADWEICPECGRPIRISQEECTYCTFKPNRQSIEFSRYWEDSNADEDWD
jgi:hypothetical protein